MKKNFKKTWFFLIVIVVLFVIGSTSVAFAVDNYGKVIKSGNCGDKGSNATFKLYEDGTLVIIGKGAIAEYEPWDDILPPYFDDESASGKGIKSVIIKNGITTIGGGAFYDCTSLKKVSLPDSLKKIDDWAFYLCKNLSGVTLSKNLESVSELAFASCNIKSLNIPKKLTEIHDRAFENNPIASYAVETGHPYLSNDKNGVLFNKNKTELRRYPSGRKVTSYSIPVKVKTIAAYAFDGNDYLETVNISDTVEAIGYNAFASCAKLSSVSLPGSLKEIEENAFAWCYELNDIIIPNGVESIGSSAFYGCKTLTKIVIPDSVKYIGSEAFACCYNLKKVSLGANITNFEGDIFSFCKKIAEVTVSNKNKNYSSYDGVVYDKAKTRIVYIPIVKKGEIKLPSTYSVFSQKKFSSRKQLAFITVEEGNKKYKSVNGLLYSADGKTLYYCPEGREGRVEIESTVKNIAESAFYKCSKITEIIVPFGVESIGDSCFSLCENLKNISLPDSITKMGSRVFAACVSLKYVKLPKNVKTYEETFDDCGSLEVIAFPDGTTKIGERCCIFAYELKNIYIPASVKEIDDCAFQCSLGQDIDIYYGGTKEQWKKIKIEGSNEGIDDAQMHYNSKLNNLTILSGSCGENLKYKLDFYGNLTITGKGKMKDFDHRFNPWYGYPVFNVILSEGITYLSDYAFMSTSIKKFVAPDSLKGIGEMCFDECSVLEEVYISTDVKSIGDEVFDDCGKLNLIKVNSDNKYYYSKNNCLIDKRTKTLIRGCSDSVIPGDVEIIGKGAFSRSEMTSVTIPANIRDIGWWAFAWCDNLRNVVFEANIKTVPVHCFSDCDELVSVTIPSSVTYIDEGAFYDCSEFKKIYFKGTKEQWKKVKIDHKNEKNVVVGFVGVITGPNQLEGLEELVIGNKNEAADNAEVIYICNCYNPSKVVTAATLSKSGRIDTKCTVCGKISETTSIPKVGSIKLSTTSYTYSDKTKTPSVVVKDSKGKILKKHTDYTVSYEEGRKLPGKYTVTITFKGNYSGTKTLYFNILPSKTSKITPTCSTTEIKASWKSVTGASGYKVELLNSKGKVVKAITTTKTAYTFEKLSKVTTYKIRVTAYKTIDSKKVYSTVSTTITTSTAPAKVTLSKVTAGSKSATLTWKTVSGATGYEVSYSTSSKFKSAKTATVKKGSSKKITIKKLTKGKKYYFKVRTYKTVDGKKVYGAWSSFKSVKVK